MSNTLNRLRKRYALNQYAITVAIGAQHPVAVEWAKRVVTNGGDTPSSNTVSALSTFMFGMDANGLTGKITLINAFVPDSLIATLTPLLKNVSSNDPWTNYNFVSGDLSVNGLQGNNSNKYLDTGINPTGLLTTTGACVIHYCTLAGSTGCTRMGSAIATGAFRFSWDNGGLGDYWSCYDTTYQGGVMNNSTYFLGYICGSKTSATTRIIYEANSTTTHYAASTTTGTDGAGHNAIPTQNLLCYCSNEGGTPVGFYPGRLSFAAVGGTGLSATDSLNLYTLVQAMRMSLGGGYV